MYWDKRAISISDITQGQNSTLLLQEGEIATDNVSMHSTCESKHATV